jgi:hypothetical protein
MIRHGEVTVPRYSLHGNADHVPVAWQSDHILSPKNSD